MDCEAVVGVVTVAPGMLATIGASGIGQLGPEVVTDTSGAVRGVVAFVLVLLTGLGIRRLGRNYVEESIGAILESPATAIVYGIAGYVIVGIVGLYGATTLARLSLAGGVLVRVGIIGGSVAVLLLTSFGFLVVGTLLTELLGARRVAHGLVVGASLCGLSWLLLSPTGGVVSSLAIAAFGIGGSARVWIHSERTVETELNGR